ncbi:MAG: BlaI/MecI/CopY family transcriptional regulator [Ruminococcaceae bacterium]|nr:BlaI/MecI/CopY family transcriptional regulator [Oscillospiraceae bacterium]
MEVKLADSEMKVMEVLWKEGDVSAKHVADVMHQRYGWNINSTYTFLKRCIRKGAVERREPGFICHACIPLEEVQRLETEKLLDLVFDGSVDKLFTAMLGSRRLTAEQLQEIKRVVEQLEEEAK